jgi:hypothetical protein
VLQRWLRSTSGGARRSSSASWRKRCGCPECSITCCASATQHHFLRTSSTACLLCAQVRALTLGRPHRNALKELMNKKEIVGDLLNQLRCAHCQLAGWQLRIHVE